METPPPGLVEGIRLFNAGSYFEAHEAFEALLDETEDDVRWQLLLGLVQAWGGQYLSGTLINAVAFGVLVLVLIVRPAGLIGRPYYEARAAA